MERAAKAAKAKQVSLLLLSLGVVFLLSLQARASKTKKGTASDAVGDVDMDPV